MFRGDPLVTFQEEGHTYTVAKSKTTPISVTRVIERFKEPFDEQRISFYMARKVARGPGWKKGEPEPAADVIEKERLRIVGEWHDKRDRSIVHGQIIHNTLENGFNGMPVRADLAELYDAVWQRFAKYVLPVAEPIVYLHNRYVVGRPDYICHRQRSGSVVDIKDIKTNLFNGIYFDSMKIKNGAVKHYNRFMTGPVAHLEDCNYNHYCLQLSMYSYIMEKQYGLRPGSHEIIHVKINEDDLHTQQKSVNFELELLPVPYMRNEVRDMIEVVYEQMFNDF